MRNVYIIIQNGAGNVNLTAALTKGKKDSIYAHENIHYSTQSGKSIINGLYTNDELIWFESQSWAYIVGDYLPTGRGESKVYTNGWTFTKPSTSLYDGYLRMKNGQFILNGVRFRNSFVNKHNIFASRLPQSEIQSFLNSCEARGIKLVRTWLLPNLFLKLVYPLASVNLFSSNPSFETDTTDYVLGTAFTRSQDTAHHGTWSIKQVSGYNTYDKLTRTVAVEANKNYVWTFRHTLKHYGGSVNQQRPRLIVGTEAKEDEITNAGFLSDTTDWLQKQVRFNSGNRTEIKVTIQNWGGRNDAYYDSFHLGLEQTPVLEEDPVAFAHADMVITEAEQRGIKLILSLADNTPNFDTKRIYVEWANAIYKAGLDTNKDNHYPGFFTSVHCKNIYKQFVDIVTTRYKSRKGVGIWELGNELRVDRFEGAGVNTINSENLTLMSKPGGWIDEMSTYIKSKDINHLVGPPACTHRYNWTNGDSVAGGSYQGIDDRIIATLPNIDYISIHFYPTQGGGEVEVNHKYGQHLGHPNTVNKEGLEAQVIDWIRVAKSNNKGFMMDEVGFIREAIGSNAIIPLYPRVNNVAYIHNLVFGNDGDGIGWWHGENNDGGSYSYNISGTWNGDTTNLNFDDRPVCQLIQERNQSFG